MLVFPFVTVLHLGSVSPASTYKRRRGPLSTSFNRTQPQRPHLTTKTHQWTSSLRPSPLLPTPRNLSLSLPPPSMPSGVGAAAVQAALSPRWRFCLSQGYSYGTNLISIGRLTFTNFSCLEPALLILVHRSITPRFHPALNFIHLVFPPCPSVRRIIDNR
jgi:hypothetical protein